MLDDDLVKAQNVLESIEDQETLHRIICQTTDEQKAEYLKQLDYVKSTNANACASTEEKGRALEELVQILLKHSGGIYCIKQNVRTNTNEIDIVCNATPKGRFLQSLRLIPDYDSFLGECKNYGTRVGVTYVGKFACLMQTTAYRLGILFSYHGVSGTGWEDACGLIRKFYMSREDIEKRYIIIDFSIREFEMVAEGKNFLDILDNKIKALQLDTEFSSLLTAHPAQNEISPHRDVQ